MQLTGNRFTSETASFGNDIDAAELPGRDPAPTGTLPGVSSFQLHFADHDIMTPGDAPDVLVVMNPAALKANLADLAGVDCSSPTPTSSRRGTWPRSGTRATRSRTARWRAGSWSACRSPA